MNKDMEKQAFVATATAVVVAIVALVTSIILSR